MKKILPTIILIVLLAACLPQPTTEPQPVLATPAAELFPLGISGNWSLVLQDEFDSAGLDRTKWYPNAVWYNCTTGGRTDQGVSAKAWWMCSQLIQPGDGLLHVTAVKHATGAAGGTTYPYWSGYMISGTSGASPSRYTYGVFEARIKGPVLPGSWNQWWLWDSLQGKGETAEIDIAEFLYNEGSRVNTNLHTATERNSSCTANTATTNWHTYSVNWQAGSIKWYVDGVNCQTYTGTAFNSKSLYLILGLQLGGTWAGSVDESKLPAEMLVDYVRVWQGVSGPTNTPGASSTPTNTRTITNTRTATLTPTQTRTPPPTFTRTPTLEPSATFTPSETPVFSPTPECHYFDSIGRLICVP